MERLDISYLLSLFYILLAFVQINLALLARRYFKGNAIEFLTSALYVVGLLYLVGGALVVGISSADVPLTSFAVLGSLLIAFAVAYGIWSLVTLRAAAFLPAHDLITVGPYKVTRHPFFTAIVILIFGLAMLYSSIVLAAYGVFTAFFLFRLALAEEGELASRFKKRFETYKKKTGAIFPRLR